MGCSGGPSAATGPFGDPAADAGPSDGGDPNPPSAVVSDAGLVDAGIDTCADGLPRGRVAGPRLVASLSPAPEGVAVCANGDVFVSIPKEAKILRVSLVDGTSEVWTVLTGHQPHGMTCVDNALYVVDFQSKDAAVLRIAAKNDPGTALPKVDGDKGYSALTAIVSVRGVGLFVTDASNSLNGRIIRFTETASGVFEASVMRSNVAFPSSLAYDPKSNSLDVALSANSQVFTYPIGKDGTLGKSVETWYGMSYVDPINGIARDENQQLYVAHSSKGFVERPTDSTKLASARNPKSLAFRGGTLFFTSDDGLQAMDLGSCGSQAP